MTPIGSTPVSALGSGILLLYLVILSGAILLVVFYYKAIIEIMAHIRPANRGTGIAHILFLFIPLFGTVYGFIIYPKISESIKKEFHALGIPEDGDFGRSLSLAMCILHATHVIGYLIPVLYILRYITPIFYVVVWIIYWVRINGYRETLLARNANGFDKNEYHISDSPDFLD